MAQIIDGKRIAKEIKDKLKEEVSVLKERGTKICLAVIQVGQDAASSVYVNNKKKACASLNSSASHASIILILGIVLITAMSLNDWCVAPTLAAVIPA